MKKTLLSAALATVLQLSTSLASENGSPFRGFESSVRSPVCLKLPSSGGRQSSPGWPESPIPHGPSALPRDYHSGATPSEAKGPLSEIPGRFNFSPGGDGAAHPRTGDPESPWSDSKDFLTPKAPASDSRYMTAARSLVADFAAAAAAPAAFGEDAKTHGYDTRRKTIDFKALARGNG